MNAPSTFVPYGECRPDLRCSICLDPWNDPVELKPCAHIFCKGCVATISTCPDCRQVIKQRSIPNRIILNLASNVMVECEQCHWIGPRRDTAAHQCPNAVPLQPAPDKKKRGFFGRLLFGSDSVAQPPPPPPPPQQPQQVQPAAPVPAPSPVPVATAAPPAAPSYAPQPAHPATAPPPQPQTPQPLRTSSTTSGRPGEDWMHEYFSQFPNLDPDVILDVCRASESRMAAYDMLSIIHADAPPRAQTYAAYSTTTPVRQPEPTPAPALVPVPVPAPPQPPIVAAPTTTAPVVNPVVTPTAVAANQPVPPRPQPSKYATQPHQPASGMYGTYSVTPQPQQPQPVPAPTATPVTPAPTQIPPVHVPAAQQSKAAPPQTAPPKPAALPAPEWDPFDPRVGATTLAEYESLARKRGVVPADPILQAVVTVATELPKDEHLDKLLDKFSTDQAPDDFDAPLFLRKPPSPPPAAPAVSDADAWLLRMVSESNPSGAAPSSNPVASPPVSTSAPKATNGALRADSWDKPLTVSSANANPVMIDATTKNEIPVSAPVIAVNLRAQSSDGWGAPIPTGQQQTSSSLLPSENAAPPPPQATATPAAGQFDDIFARFAAED